MKKRVRILVSLLMISGSLTLTSKSYASNDRPNAYCVSTIIGGAGLAFSLVLKDQMKRLLVSSHPKSTLFQKLSS